MKVNKGLLFASILIVALVGCSSSPAPIPTESAARAGQECTSVGKKQKVSGSENFLECRYEKTGKLSYVELTGSTAGQLLTEGLSPIETCKLQDQRAPGGFGGSQTGQNTAFPLTNTVIPPKGNFKIGIIPIDFSDSIAEKSVKELMSPHLNIVDEWLTFTTNGATTYNWVMPDEWLRMPLDSSHYKYAKNNIAPDGSYITVEEQLQTTEDMTSQIFTAAEQFMKLDEIDYFWVVLPPTTTNVDWTVNGVQIPVQTPSGVHYLTFYSLANVLWNQQTNQAPMYGILLHEMLHAHGAAQHAPGNEYAMHVGNSIGSVMGAWDSFILGWRPDAAFACIDGTQAFDITVELTPLDHNETGYKAALVKLSDQEILVIESRRKGPFSYKWIDGAAFVTAYVVNTSKLSVRYDGDNSRVKDYFSYYLEINTPHGEEIQLGQPLANMNGPSAENFAIRHIGLKEDIFEYAGVSITVVEQNDTDTVHIVRSN